MNCRTLQLVCGGIQSHFLLSVQSPADANAASENKLERVKIPFQPAKKMSFSSGFYLLAFLLARFVWFWHTLSLFLKQFPLFVHGLRKIPIKDAENVATDKVITARSCPVNKINNNRFIKGVDNGLNGNGYRRQQARIEFTMVIYCL